MADYITVKQCEHTTDITKMKNFDIQNITMTLKAVQENLCETPEEAQVLLFFRLIYNLRKTYS
jgi:hypothetical protein